MEMGLLFWGLIGAVAGAFVVSLALGPSKEQMRQADAVLKQMARESEERRRAAEETGRRLDQMLEEYDRDK